MIEILKTIGIIIGILLLLGFLLGTLGILMLCALFGNVFGFAIISLFDILLCIGLYLYSEEEL